MLKAIIPVAGTGAKLRPLTYTQPKPLIPVAGKPIIAFIIEELLEIGVEEFIFVIGYLGEKIRHYVEAEFPQINKVFVTQFDRKGSGHAIWTAGEHVHEGDELIIFFGDTIIEADFKSIMAIPYSCVAVQRVNNPRDFGVVEYDTDGSIRRMVEKPAIPLSDMAMVGFYKINDPRALILSLEHNILNNIRSDAEFPLTDGLTHMIEQGHIFKSVQVDNWFDCGKKQVLLETNATLLEKGGYASSDLPDYDNTIVIHPVSIGHACQISNSIIGPHVTIGNNAIIDSAIVRESIIGNYASIREVVLQNSVIGSDTAITGLRQSLNIGDNTEIDFR